MCLYIIYTYVLFILITYVFIPYTHLIYIYYSFIFFVYWVVYLSARKSRVHVQNWSPEQNNSSHWANSISLYLKCAKCHCTFPSWYHTRTAHSPASSFLRRDVFVEDKQHLQMGQYVRRICRLRQDWDSQVLRDGERILRGGRLAELLQDKTANALDYWKSELNVWYEWMRARFANISNEWLGADGQSEGVAGLPDLITLDIILANDPKQSSWMTKTEEPKWNSQKTRL